MLDKKKRTSMRVSFSVRMSKEMRENCREMANQDRRKLGDFIGILIEQELERRRASHARMRKLVSNIME